MTKKGKTNFVESILLTLKVMVVGLILGLGTWFITFVVGMDNMSTLWIVRGIWFVFNLWFFGFLLNRLWKFK